MQKGGECPALKRLRPLVRSPPINI
jgi:hypothetical protein